MLLAGGRGSDGPLADERDSETYFPENILNSFATGS
jgi:hypothetical protein